MTDRREDTNQIFDLLSIYFDALYEADASKLATVLRTDGIYVSTTNGDYLNRTIPDYLAVVTGREPPKARGEQRDERVTTIEFGGPNMAFVRLNMSMMGRRYTDFLTLYKEDGVWKIMAKIFSYNPEVA
ncbi:nuclear transport factor 2 family protein [Terasakiella sp. A23]|uniref:nuclear transport factor 2 family protein n=1 Tax=Terasakiella sp. FCG-A23 TaxID=3080561 RepID=UPI002952BDE3|nr:nuclear transport factor 2 family protein [Terasakiella sp. A23]MDV7340481.1 nuclear transport factor 2 family protein [Terasakiella sp. A23]